MIWEPPPTKEAIIAKAVELIYEGYCSGEIEKDVVQFIKKFKQKLNDL